MWVRRLYRHGGSLCIAVPSQIVKAKKLRVGRHLAFVLDKDSNMLLEEVIVGGAKRGAERRTGG